MPGKIRLATKDDAEAVARIYAPSVLTPISFEAEAPSPMEMRGRIQRITQDYPWLVYEDEVGEVMGYVYAGRHSERHAYQWSVDVTAYVDRSAQRRGIARALYTSLFELLRLQGFTNAYAGITLPNEASVGLHKSLGFQTVGVYKGVGWKLGAWHDVAYLALRLAELRPSPKPPVPLPEIVTSREVTAAIAKGEVLLSA